MDVIRIKKKIRRELRHQYANYPEEMIQQFIKSAEGVIEEYIPPKDKRRKSDDLYRRKNYHEINATRECFCGGKYSRAHKSRHEKTKKHQKYLM